MTYLSGVCGVDDSVVPEAGAGVESVALLLVLRQDRLLEGRLLLSRPRVACGK